MNPRVKGGGVSDDEDDLRRLCWRNQRRLRGATWPEHVGPAVHVAEQDCPLPGQVVDLPSQSGVDVCAPLGPVRDVNHWHVAALAGDVNSMPWFLEMPELCGHFDQVDERGDTPLHVAVQYRRWEVVEFLMKTCKASANIKNDAGQTVRDLAMACRDGYDDFARVRTLFGPDAVAPTQGRDWACRCLIL